MILAPSLYSADHAMLGQTVTELQNVLKWVHIDIMDGQFVPNITFGHNMVKALRKYAPKLYFDVHLMVRTPSRFIEEYRNAGADMLVVHAEAEIHLQRVLADIRSKGMKAGVALNPSTPLTALDYIMDDVDMILLMSVNPGFGGQKFIPSTLKKVFDLKQKLIACGKQDCLIEVDGGVNLDNARSLVQAGADVLVSGSAFINYPPFQERYNAFIKAVS